MPDIEALLNRTAPPGDAVAVDPSFEERLEATCEQVWRESGESFRANEVFRRVGGHRADVLEFVAEFRKKKLAGTLAETVPTHVAGLAHDLAREIYKLAKADAGRQFEESAAVMARLQVGMQLDLDEGAKLLQEARDASDALRRELAVAGEVNDGLAEQLAAQRDAIAESTATISSLQAELEAARRDLALYRQLTDTAALAARITQLEEAAVGKVKN